jgi:hypothetical protein
MEFKVVSLISRFKRWLSDCRYERKHGFKRSDLWSLDHTILLFVLPRLKEFRRTAHTFPLSMFYVDPENPTEEELNNPDQYRDSDSAAAFAKWEATLDKMIWSMSEMIEEDGMFWDYSLGGVDEEKTKKVDEGMALFHKYFFSLWD